MVFPAALTAADRCSLHAACEAFGLLHEARGDEPERQLVVWKRVGAWRYAVPRMDCAQRSGIHFSPVCYRLCVVLMLWLGNRPPGACCAACTPAHPCLPCHPPGAPSSLSPPPSMLSSPHTHTHPASASSTPHLNTYHSRLPGSVLRPAAPGPCVPWPSATASPYTTHIGARAGRSGVPLPDLPSDPQPGRSVRFGAPLPCSV